MVLGAELIIILSLAVVLAIVFVALLCDFLKGNNEQLHQRNIELRVRQDERDRMGLSQPLAWLQGLAALARQQGMPEAGGEGFAGGETAGTPGAGAAPAAAARAAQPDAPPPPPAPQESSQAPRSRYDEMKASSRSTSWASKEELEQLAGRAARIRARHEAAQKGRPTETEEQPAVKGPEPSPSLSLVTAPLLRGRGAEVTPIRVPEPPAEPLVEARELSAIVEPALPLQQEVPAPAEAPFGSAESEWEFTIDGEDASFQEEAEPAVTEMAEPPVFEQTVAEHPGAALEESAAAVDANRTDAVADDTPWSFTSSQSWDSVEPLAEDLPASPLPGAEAGTPVEVIAPAETSLSAGQPADLAFGPAVDELFPDQAQEVAETDVAGPVPADEPPAIASEVITRGAVDADLWDVETWSLESEPQSGADVAGKSEGDDGGSYHDIASEIFSGYTTQPPAASVSPVQTESLLGAEARHEPELLRRPIPVPVECVSARDTDTAAIADSTPEAVTPLAEEPPSEAVGASAGVTEDAQVAGWSWSREEEGLDAFDQPFRERDSSDVAAVLASAGDSAGASSAVFAAQPEAAVEVALWKDADEPEPLGQPEQPTAEAPSAGPAPHTEDPAVPPSGGQVKELGYDSALETMPTGLQPAEVLTHLIESHTSFRGVAVAVGINDYESLKDKLASSSGSDSLTALNKMIVSMLGPQDFAARFADEEFILLYPGESGSAAQRRLFQVSEKLWDFQLRSLGSLSIMFSWGGLEVNGETLADSVMAARERMYQTRRSRKTSQVELGVTRRRVVNG
jgi:GGDEF domain-containing protein